MFRLLYKISSVTHEPGACGRASLSQRPKSESESYHKNDSDWEKKSQTPALQTTHLTTANKNADHADSDAKYSVFPIKPPISPAELTAYKTLRLTSLQIDPHAFGSTYAREVAFTEDVWQERLDSLLKQTVIASVSSHERGNDNGDEPALDAGETGEWVGTATIIGPSGVLPSVLAPFRDAGVGANWEIYALYAMWVHPAHRGKGVGTRLVKACLEWARTNVDTTVSGAGENDGDVEKVVVLLVYDNNVAGRALYSRAGFTELEGVSAREGERWMLARV